MIKRIFGFFKSLLSADNKQAGNAMASVVVSLVVGIVVIGILITNLWPVITTTAAANVSGLTGTDAGTTFLVAFWPVVLVMAGIAVGVGVVYWILRETNVM